MSFLNGNWSSLEKRRADLSLWLVPIAPNFECCFGSFDGCTVPQYRENSPVQTLFNFPFIFFVAEEIVVVFAVADRVVTFSI